MRKILIHPTHRKFIRLLRKQFEKGTPVVILKKELDNIFETLPSIQTPTARNQYIYRETLRAINRPLSKIQECTDLIVFREKNINLVESFYAQVERKHICSTLINTLVPYIARRKSKRKNV